MVCGGRSAKTLHDEYDKADNRHQSGKSEIGNRKSEIILLYYWTPPGRPIPFKNKKIESWARGRPGGANGDRTPAPPFFTTKFLIKKIKKTLLK
jgi:hypothetical protein